MEKKQVYSWDYHEFLEEKIPDDYGFLYKDMIKLMVFFGRLVKGFDREQNKQRVFSLKNLGYCADS